MPACCFHCICTCVVFVFTPALHLHLYWYCHAACFALVLHLGCTCVRILCPICIVEGDLEESAFALAPACFGVHWYMLLVAIACSCTCAAAVVLLVQLCLHVCEFVKAWQQQSFVRSVNSYSVLPTRDCGHTRLISFGAKTDLGVAGCTPIIEVLFQNQL